jgi:DNA-binding SARP family transcriptional activator
LSEAGTRVSKCRLAALLWGDRGEAQARSSLRQALLELRHSVNGPREVVCSDREHIWISPDSLSEDPVSPAGQWQDAFEDLDNITPEFDEWLAGERTRRAVAYVARLKAEAEELLANDHAEETRVLVRQIQTVDPCDEDALRLGMKADFQGGHAGAVVEQYREVEALLEAEFGVRPSDKTRDLRDQLLFRLNERHQPGPIGETDQDYFARRASEERFAAASAPSEKARQLHEILADRYEEIAATLS